MLNTDYDWHGFLCEQQPVEEVNFWQPSGKAIFHGAEPGTPVFFRLKSPYNAIGGFGFFARASVLPTWLAWEAFGMMNGAPDFPSMTQRLEKYIRKERRDSLQQHRIGCLMISEPTFFGRDAWVEQPSDWHPNIVTGRTEDLSRGEGRRIFEQCMTRIESRVSVDSSVLFAESTSGLRTRPRFGKPMTVRPRLGQGTFKVCVMDAYGRACAVSDEHSLPALDAAHIRPYADGGEHAVENGVLLRSDIHRLFDAGYVTITPDMKFEVSSRLKDDYENGRSYYPLHGRKIGGPTRASDRPSADALRWHAENRYLG